MIFHGLLRERIRESAYYFAMSGTAGNGLSAFFGMNPLTELLYSTPPSTIPEFP